MDLSFTPEEAKFRADARAWLTDHVPVPNSLAPMDTKAGQSQHRAWESAMAESRWSVVSWPQEYGGRNASLIEWLIFEEEYYRAQAPRRVSQSGVFLLGPTLLEHGTHEQKLRFLPRIASGAELWCQGWSEPGAGSDLAGIRAKATRSRNDDGWVLSGQKTWCSRGAVADWCFGIFRTGDADSRHAGLTYFLIPLDSGGVEVRPIRQLDGQQGFADIFFDDVFVPDENVVGEVGQGWRVAMSTASSERGLTLRSPARFWEAARRLLRDYGRAESSADARARARATLVRDDVATACLRAEAYKVAGYWTAWHVGRGRPVGAEASANKVFWSELDVLITSTALALRGPGGELVDGVSDGDEESTWLDDYLFALAGPIYGGTNEIQRTIVAERLLGLPRG